MKKVLIALLLGITLVGCGAKRDVDYISVENYSVAEYYFDEVGYNETEIMKLIIDDIKKADTMYQDYSNLIKTDNYIIVYDVYEVDGNNYTIWIHDIEYGDKEYIEDMYAIAKDVYKELFEK